MATKKITFDPEAGVSYAADLVINGGADFTTNYEVVGTSNTAFNLEGYSGSSQMRKSAAIGSGTTATATFAVGFTSAANGKFKISLGSTQTANLSEGRYIYDVLVSSGSTIYRITDGNILVRGGISSAP